MSKMKKKFIWMTLSPRIWIIRDSELWTIYLTLSKKKSIKWLLTHVGTIFKESSEQFPLGSNSDR